MHPDDNAPVTRGVLKETLVATLGEFTEEVLLPAVGKIMDDKLGETKTELKEYVNDKVGGATHELKGYVDEKIGGLRGDIVSIMKTGKERDQHFKTKMVDIVERNRLAPADEVALLHELAQ